MLHVLQPQLWKCFTIDLRTKDTEARYPIGSSDGLLDIKATASHLLKGLKGSFPGGHSVETSQRAWFSIQAVYRKHGSSLSIAESSTTSYATPL